MATVGQVNTNTTYDSFFWVYWSQQSQDVAANKTTIYWSCGVTCGHSFYSNAIEMSEVRINGTLVYSGGTYSNFSKGEHRIAYGYMDIPHNADGTKTFNISDFTGWLYSNYNYSAGASSHTLNQIPRGAGLTGADDFKDTENPKITYSNPAGNSVTALEACISLTGATDDIKYRSITKTGTSYTFALTDAERNLLRSNTSGTSRTVHFYLRSTIGGNTFHSSLIKTFTVTENSATKPAVSLDVSLNNGSLPSIFNGLYIQGKSKVNVKVTADSKPGASISSLYAVVEGKTYNSGDFTSDAIQSSSAITVTGFAKDSRGFTGSAEQTVNVIPYAKPMVVPLSGENAILCYRSDGNGHRVGASTSVWIKAKRSYYSISGKNTCALQWRWKYATEEWNDGDEWVELLSNTDFKDEYDAMVSGTFDLDKSYTIQIRAVDYIGEHDIKTLEVPTQDVALHLGRGGKNVTVGSYCDYAEDYTFRSYWKAIFDKEVTIGGQQLVNFLVEEGTDGIWKYRKWADGTAECFGIYVQENVAIDKAWGNLFESPGYVVDLPGDLFVETPQFSITLTGSQGALLEAYSEGSATQSPHMCAIRPFAITTAILNTSIVCCGRWK